MHGYCSGTFVTLFNSETYKETTKGKFHHITVKYPVLIRVLVLFSNVYGTVLMSTVWVLVSVQ